MTATVSTHTDVHVNGDRTVAWYRQIVCNIDPIRDAEYYRDLGYKIIRITTITTRIEEVIEP